MLIQLKIGFNYVITEAGKNNMNIKKLKKCKHKTKKSEWEKQKRMNGSNKREGTRYRIF